MSKQPRALGLASTVTIVFVGFTPSVLARPEAAPTTPPPTAQRAHAAAVPAPPALVAGPSTCASTAGHVLAIALERFEQGIDEAAGPRLESVYESLQRQCEAAWSPDQRDCVLRAEDMRAIEACVPQAPASPVRALPARATGCDDVGAHLAELMRESMSSLEQDNVAAQVLVDPEALRENARAACRDAAWSESLRLCFARATLFHEIVSCKRDHAR